MFLHNLVDDREPKARPFFAMGNIRLGQAATVFLWKAAAIIRNLDDDLVICRLNTNFYAALWQVLIAGFPSLDGIGAILQQVGEDTIDLRRITSAGQ